MPQLPTGANSPNNPYYSRRNHVKLAKEQETPTRFLTGPGDEDEGEGDAEPALVLNDGLILHDANHNQFVPAQG